MELCLYVTSFSVFFTEVNSEYWSQKCTQNGNIHSIELDVYAENWEAECIKSLTLFTPTKKR